MFLLCVCHAAQYIVQYHEDAPVDADIVIGSFKADIVESSTIKHLSRTVVKQITKDTIFHTNGMQQNPFKHADVFWGVDRIDARVGLDDQYHFSEAGGRGVDVFVIDSGIDINHKEFGGRAQFGYDATGEGYFDGTGHGTHVAAIVGGELVGVAKQAQIIALKAVTRDGNSQLSYLLQCLSWAYNYMQTSKRKSVVNMSVGGEYTQMLNDAVNAAYHYGLQVVVSAGNDGKDSCRASPASAQYAIAVAATDRADVSVPLNNYGACINLFAPGQDIISAHAGTTEEYRVSTGTSMAAPHVAGVLAVYLSQGLTVWDLLNQATSEVVQNVPPNTVNVLLYM